MPQGSEVDGEAPFVPMYVCRIFTNFSLLLFYLTLSPHMFIQLTGFSLERAAFRLIFVEKASSGCFSSLDSSILNVSTAYSKLKGGI